MGVSLHIVYEGNTGRPLTAAKVNNRELIKMAGIEAAKEAFDRASLIAESDELLGNMQKWEAERLKRVLQLLIPELEPPQVEAANGAAEEVDTGA
jgi:hypothetical protein